MQKWVHENGFFELARDISSEDLFFGHQYFGDIPGDLFVTITSKTAEMTFSVFLRT